MQRTRIPRASLATERETWRGQLKRSVIRSRSQLVLAVLLSLAIPALAASPASVSGVVQDSSHTPLMGAVVELFGSEAFPVLTAFTDIRGQYQFSNIAPGRYSIRVLQASSLPARKKNIRVESSTQAIVNLTLVSLFSVSDWFPAVPRGRNEPADNWTWTLRSGIDRPILRWTDDLNGVHPDNDTTRRSMTRPVEIHAAFTGGSSQFGEGGFRQEAFVRVREGSTNDAVVHVLTSSSGAAFMAGGIERNPGPGDTARAVASFRTLPIDYGTGLDRLQILQFRGAEQLTLSDALVAQFGAESEAIQAGQNVTAALPFMAVHLQQGGNEVSYRLATSSDLQELTDLASAGGVPAVAMQDGNLRLTHSLHQELSVQRKIAGMQMEAAYYYDHLVDPVLNGYGDGSAAEFAAGDVLLDPVTGAFRTAGPNYSGGGFRVFAARQVKGNLWTALEYAEGPAIALPAGTAPGAASFTEALTSVATERTQSVLVSMQGRLPGAGTKWDAGYRWQPEETITAVDPFNTGMSAPFLSVTIHQPLNSDSSSVDKLELELVMQNILAQGYRPFYVVSGQTLYFAQAPRLLTGGLAFSF